MKWLQLHPQILTNLMRGTEQLYLVFFFFNTPSTLTSNLFLFFPHFSHAFNRLSCTLMLFSKKKGAMHIYGKKGFKTGAQF